MCLLSYYPEHVQPDPSRLVNGADANPDGHGFAIATTHDGLIVRRGMNAEDIIDMFLDLRRKHPDGPAMFHSRFGTSGVRDTGNCHPFPVGHDDMTAVAHNGILFSVPKSERRSDTRIFAETTMPQRYRRLDRPGVRQQLEKCLGSFNKIAVITVNPRYRKRGYLFNEQAGYWVGPDGLGYAANDGTMEWHSNCDYKPGFVYTWRDRDWAYTFDKTQRDCPVCHVAHSVGRLTRICEICQCCGDCREHVDNCQCYIPRRPLALTSSRS